VAATGANPVTVGATMQPGLAPQWLALVPPSAAPCEVCLHQAGFSTSKDDGIFLFKSICFARSSYSQVTGLIKGVFGGDGPSRFDLLAIHPSGVVTAQAAKARMCTDGLLPSHEFCTVPTHCMSEDDYCRDTARFWRQPSLAVPVPAGEGNYCVSVAVSVLGPDADAAYFGLDISSHLDGMD
jgi:hypothetical protein